MPIPQRSHVLFHAHLELVEQGGGGVTGLNTPPWESWPGIPLQCLPSGEPGDWGEVSRGGA